jgi:hypothetical protein
VWTRTDRWRCRVFGYPASLTPALQLCIVNQVGVALAMDVSELRDLRSTGRPQQQSAAGAGSGQQRREQSESGSGNGFRLETQGEGCLRVSSTAACLCRWLCSSQYIVLQVAVTGDILRVTLALGNNRDEDFKSEFTLATKADIRGRSSSVGPIRQPPNALTKQTHCQVSVVVELCAKTRVISMETSPGNDELLDFGAHTSLIRILCSPLVSEGAQACGGDIGSTKEVKVRNPTDVDMRMVAHVFVGPNDMSGNQCTFQVRGSRRSVWITPAA